MVTEAPRDWVIYLRKSKGKVGIPRQRNLTTAHLERRGGRVTAEFSDADRTAFQRAGEDRPPREGFDQMVAYLRAHPGVGVGALDADRLTRGDDDTRTIATVCAAGRHLIETARYGTYDLATAAGRKRFRDDASTAMYEVDHMIERITDAKNEAVANGEDLGGRRRFGWQKKADGFGVILPEAEAIATGTRGVVAGMSLAAVERAWNASGVTTTTGKRWAREEVRRVLLRARNAGLLEHHGQIAGKGTGWEAIVTEDEWRQCKAILTAPSRRTTPGPERKHLLSGLALCGVCGAPVVATATKERVRGSRTVYRDRPRTTGRGHVARDAAALDHYARELVIAWIERHGKNALSPPAPDTTLLHKRLREVEAGLAVLDAGAADKSISAPQLVQWGAPLNKEAAEIRDKIAAATATAVPAHVFTEDDIRAGVTGASLDAQRSMVKALMTLVILPQPRGRPPGHTPGEPYFRSEFIRVEWKQGSA